MKKRKTDVKKLKLAKETLGALDPRHLAGLAGATATGTYCPAESAEICSEVHTCVSCNWEMTTT